MKKVKEVARLIMIFILTVSIIAFLAIYLISNTIFSEAYVVSSLEKSDYYNKTYQLLKSNFGNYIQQSGLDENILNDIVTKEQVEKDTKKIIMHIFDGIEEDISIQALKQRLKNNIDSSVNIEYLSTESKNAIDQFIEEICKEYKSTIIHSQYEKEINNVYKKIANIINTAKRFTIIAICVSIIIIIILNLRRVYKIATNISIAMLGSGIFGIIVNVYIKSNVRINYITILNDAVSDVIRNILNDILSRELIYSIFLSIIGLIVIIIANFIHNVFKYKSLMQDNALKEK